VLRVESSPSVQAPGRAENLLLKNRAAERRGVLDIETYVDAYVLGPHGGRFVQAVEPVMERVVPDRLLSELGFE
jgi:hypothetical protein